MDNLQPQIKEEIRDTLLDVAVMEIAEYQEEIKRLKAEIAELKGVTCAIS